jgi:hypothetical protein
MVGLLGALALENGRKRRRTEFARKRALASSTLGVGNFCRLLVEPLENRSPGKKAGKNEKKRNFFVAATGAWKRKKMDAEA